MWTENGHYSGNLFTEKAIDVIKGHNTSDVSVSKLFFPLYWQFFTYAIFADFQKKYAKK